LLAVVSIRISASTFCIISKPEVYVRQHKHGLDLAKEAINIERHVLQNPVGFQDQTFAAVGGLNRITFSQNNNIQIEPISLTADKLSKFQNHLLLFFTGIKRRANDIIEKQIIKVEDNKERLQKMRKFVDDGFDILTNSEQFDEFGGLLDKSWQIKRKLDNSVSTLSIDEFYEKGIKSGAYGGKLLGAGGGGFLLFFVSPNQKDSVRNSLKELTEIPIKLSNEGSIILRQ